ncbi:MAG: hypothetical protein KDH94_07120, partial [Coxiellaceae bacterium]|nr:hypothetical protein [Coxiellaceae bacterium]
MRFFKKGFLTLTLIAWLAPAFANLPPSNLTSIQELRINITNSKSRFVFDTDKPIRFHRASSNNPNEVLVDL